MFIDFSFENINLFRSIKRFKVKDKIAFATIFLIFRYNFIHKFKSSALDDKGYFPLHYSYILFQIVNQKFNN